MLWTAKAAVSWSHPMPWKRDALKFLSFFTSISDRIDPSEIRSLCGKRDAGKKVRNVCYLSGLSGWSGPSHWLQRFCLFSRIFSAEIHIGSSCSKDLGREVNASRSNGGRWQLCKLIILTTPDSLLIPILLWLLSEHPCGWSPYDRFVKRLDFWA